METHKYGLQPREEDDGTASFGERAYEAVKKLEKEYLDKPAHDTHNPVSESGRNSISLLAIRNEFDPEQDNVITDGIIITHNVHPLFTVHTMLKELYGVLEKAGYSKNVDIGLHVKIPAELQKYVGSEEVCLKMGEDCGSFPPEMQDRIVESVLSYNIDTFLKELLKMKVDKYVSKS